MRGNADRVNVTRSTVERTMTSVRLLAALVLTTLLGACGAPATTPAANGAAIGAAAARSAAADAEEITLEVRELI